MNITSFFGVLTDILVSLILVFSLIRGVRHGAVREFFGLVAFVIALLLAGLFTHYVVGWLSFIGDLNWRNFLAFLLAMAIILVVAYLILWIPRHFIDKVWDSGFVWSLLGGIFALIDCALGLALTVKLLNLYPVLNWLNSVLASSQVLSWLSANFGPFITWLLQALAGKTI